MPSSVYAIRHFLCSPDSGMPHEDPCVTLGCELAPKETVLWDATRFELWLNILVFNTNRMCAFYLFSLFISFEVKHSVP